MNPKNCVTFLQGSTISIPKFAIILTKISRLIVFLSNLVEFLRETLGVMRKFCKRFRTTVMEFERIFTDVFNRKNLRNHIKQFIKLLRKPGAGITNNLLKTIIVEIFQSKFVKSHDSPKFE